MKETIEVANDDGLFDKGFHRRLSLKPASPERSKPGSFESIQAKVDGRDAHIKTTQENDIMDIGLSAEGHGRTRGGHIIELTWRSTSLLCMEILKTSIKCVWGMVCHNSV